MEFLPISSLLDGGIIETDVSVDIATPRKRHADAEFDANAHTERPRKKRTLVLPASESALRLPPPESPRPTRSGTNRGHDISGPLVVPTGATTPASSDDGTDADDADSIASDETITSSYFNYPIICGRTYDAYDSRGFYLFPNDKDQQKNMDLRHDLHLMASSGTLDDVGGKLYSAPITANPQRILDVGTGTGIWAIEVAAKHESAMVVGIDLSPIQPNWVPPNCYFVIDDFNAEWKAGNDWDFIHIRDLNGAVMQWPEKYKAIMQHLKPGGWVEQAEFSWRFESDDGTLPTDSALSRCGQIFKEIGEKIGQTFEAGERASASIVAAGFTNVNERTSKVPIGKWAKDKTLTIWGEMCRDFLSEGFDGFLRRGLIEVLGWSELEVAVYLRQLQDELLDSNIHAYFIMYRVHGQKPESSG